MTKKISLTYVVKANQSGERVDVVSAKSFPEFSRNHVQKWIKEGALLINGKKTKSKQILQGGELIEVKIDEEVLSDDQPEDIKINVIFEDRDIIIINKPPNLVVHPGAGNRKGTLVNGLINYDTSLAYLPRAGIVHRLDKDTSGLMVVARNEKSYLNLINQLKKRTFVKKYSALVVGEPSSGRVIDKPIGRHPRYRTKQAVVRSGKEAVTKFKLVKKLNGYSLLEVSILTGRTHQIRVHLSYIGFPIIGDSTYGGRKRFAKGTSENLRKIISGFQRQALHASFLSLKHPTRNEFINFKTKLPQDIALLTKVLEHG